MDDAGALAGLKLLVAGGELAAVQVVSARLGALGADTSVLAGDVDALARAAATHDAVVAVDAIEAPLRARLDPFGLPGAPLVVGVHAIAAADAELGAVAAARLRALVESRAQKERNAELEATVTELALTRRRDADAALEAFLQRLLHAAGYRDDNTYEHTQRVAGLAARLARELGLAPREVALIHQGAPLHDIGKIAIPDSILLKPGPLTPEEFEVIKSHAVLGARVLAGGGSQALETAEAIARHHHERWDGEGYPDGLAGGAIPIAARLVHLADVFDVLVHERPYKESWTVERAAEEIAGGAGTDFDPDVARAFARLGPEGWRAD